MNTVIFGGTGMVGNALQTKLINEGHHLYIMTRSPDKYRNTHNITYVDAMNSKDLEAERIDVVINLAGENLFGYWTKKKKAKILDSRLKMVGIVKDFIDRLPQIPKLWINASAVGIYEPDLEKTYTETNQITGSNFLSEVVEQWEYEVDKYDDRAERIVKARFGIVLAQGGTLQLMQLPFKLFAGGKIGNGQQWISWIHLTDLANLMNHVIHTPELEGVINFTSPEPVRNEVFMKNIGSSLNRPYWLHVPRFAFKLLLGEMSLLVVDGQKVLPERVLTSQFKFDFPILKEALDDLNK